MQRRTSVLLWVMIVPLAAVATALVSQYQFHMQPCAWCVLQRLIFIVIALAAALALLLRVPRIQAGFTAVIALLAGSGIASALYQHFVAARANSCGLSLAAKIVGRTLHLDTLAAPVFAIRGSCSDAPILLGIPYEFWSLALFALIALGATMLTIRLAVHPAGK